MTPIKTVLLTLLITAVFDFAHSDQARALTDVGVGRDQPIEVMSGAYRAATFPKTHPQAGPPSLIIVAQAGDPQTNSTHQQELSLLLDRDDIAEAIRYVEALAQAGEVGPETAESMKDQIWRTKTDRVIEYSEKMRAAIAASDVQSMKDYSGRLQRLMAPASDDDLAPPEGTAAADVQTSEQSLPDKPEPSAAPEVDESPTAMQRALEEGHLFSPPTEGAFDLAVTRLRQAPDDREAGDVLDRVIVRQQSDVLSDLRSGKPELALASANRLLDAFNRSETDDDWHTSRRSRVERWIDQKKPEIAAGLITESERAIARLNLTKAPDNELSALGYLDLLASLLGQSHEETATLAEKIIGTYTQLVDDRLAKQQYAGALDLVDRMAVIAERFDVALDTVETMRSDIKATQSKLQQHDQLLLLAARWRDKGRLIGPEGANALDATARAVKLAAKPAEANEVLDSLFTEQRYRIDELIKAGRLRDAGTELERFAAAIDQADVSHALKPSDLYAEAKQLWRQADIQDARHQQSLLDAADKARQQPEVRSDDNDSPFTFINPF